jgi:hypothetical protein
MFHIEFCFFSCLESSSHTIGQKKQNGFLLANKSGRKESPRGKKKANRRSHKIESETIGVLWFFDFYLALLKSFLFASPRFPGPTRLFSSF